MGSLIRKEETSTTYSPPLGDLELIAPSTSVGLPALLEARRQRPDHHLAYEESESYVDGQLPGEDDAVLLEQHLWHCEFCRGVVAELLQLGSNASSRAQQFLERVERHRLLKTVAQVTAETVRERHRRLGGNLIYARDGVLIEEPLDEAIAAHVSEPKETSEA